MKIFVLFFMVLVCKRHNRELQIRNFLKKYYKKHRRLNDKKEE